MWLYHACIIPLVTRSSNAAQNVNKVNTKATLRCPIDTPWIPLWARDHLKKTVRSSHSTSYSFCDSPLCSLRMSRHPSRYS